MLKNMELKSVGLQMLQVLDRFGIVCHLIISFSFSLELRALFVDHSNCLSWLKLSLCPGYFCHYPHYFTALARSLEVKA